VYGFFRKLPLEALRRKRNKALVVKTEWDFGPLSEQQLWVCEKEEKKRGSSSVLADSLGVR